MVMVGWVNYYF